MNPGWKIIPFTDAIEDVTSGNLKTPQSEFLAEGKFPIVDQGKELVAGYGNDPARLCKAELPAIIFGDHTRCFKYIDFPFCIGADGVKVLRPKIESDEKYLFHFLRQAQLTDAGYDRHFKHLKRIDIVLPPLPEQRRIAAILDQAEALRAKRRAALAKLDTLAQSIFIEMFGDPAINPKRWDLQKIGNLATKFSDGPFGSNLKSQHYTESGIRVIRLQNIGCGEMLDHDLAYISESHFASLRKHECLPGDVLIGTLGDPNLRACIQPDSLPIALNKADCVQMRVHAKLAHPIFVSALLNHPSTERMAQGLILGQTRGRISMGRLRDLKIPVPPVALQALFASRMVSLNGIKRHHISSISALDSLFASLQHRAFRGEL